MDMVETYDNFSSLELSNYVDWIVDQKGTNGIYGEILPSEPILDKNNISSTVDDNYFIDLILSYSGSNMEDIKAS